MTDPIEEYGRNVKIVEASIEAVESALSMAEGVKSTISGTGGGTSDIEARYVSLLEVTDRLRERWERLDDDRQTLYECIQMVEDERQQLILTCALADAQRHGTVTRTHIARRMGVYGMTITREYPKSLDTLTEVMRQHKAF